MDVRPSILCPVDFSDASAGALRYAAAIASHFGTRLIVLTVEDPLLTEAADLGTGIRWDPEHCKQEMAEFTARTFGPQSPLLATLEYDVAVGKPAPEILRVARERSCDLIVISTHGLTGIRKLFFGSTTERVLRETTRPVLITPPVDPGPVSLDDARRILRRIVVPVDLSPASRHQAAIAAGLSKAAGVPLILVHVIEPVKSPLAARLHLAGVEANRRAVAEDELQAIAASSASSGSDRSVAGVWRSRRGARQGRTRSRGGTGRHGTERVPGARPADGIGDLSDAVPGAHAGAGAAAGAHGNARRTSDKRRGGRRHPVSRAGSLSQRQR